MAIQNPFSCITVGTQILNFALSPGIALKIMIKELIDTNILLEITKNTFFWFSLVQVFYKCYQEIIKIK